MEASDSTSAPGRLKEVAFYILCLGFTAFGGQAAHIAIMQDDLVKRRKWLDEQQFLDCLASPT